MLGLFTRNNKLQEVEVTVSNRTIMRLLLSIIASLVLVLAVRKAEHALILIFVSLFLALAFNAPVHWLADRLPGRKKGNRTLATSLSFLFIVIVLTGFAASIVPPLIRQTDNFIEAAPGLVDNVHNQNSDLGKFIRRYNLEKQVDEFSDQLSSRLGTLSGTLFGTISKITSSVFSMLAVWVLTFMMLIEGPRWLDVFRRFIPKNKRGHAEKVAYDMYKVIKGYVNGQVLLAAIAAVVIFIALEVLGVRYPVALMVVVFFCGLIPMIGHIIGAIIVTLVALINSPTDALIIFVYYIAYQQIENYVIQPRLQANLTNLSPLLVFSAALIGISLNGLLGGLVAIPIAGCLRVLVLDYVNRRNLLEPVPATTDTR